MCGWETERTAKAMRIIINKKSKSAMEFATVEVVAKLYNYGKQSQ